MKLSELKIGDKIYCCLVNNANSNEDRILELEVTGSITTDGNFVIVPGLPEPIWFNKEHQDAIESSWFNTKEEALNNPIGYIKEDKPITLNSY